jgi:hypothetical protein
MVHLALILFVLVAASPTMLTIGLKVLSIMPEILTVRPGILCVGREVAVLIT